MKKPNNAPTCKFYGMMVQDVCECQDCVRRREMNNVDDFKNYPKSISEIKANKDENAATWTPRDALISFLRRLDAGEFPNLQTLVIMGVWRDNEVTHSHYSVSSPTLQDTLGCIELGRLKMYMDGRVEDGK